MNSSFLTQIKTPKILSISDIGEISIPSRMTYEDITHNKEILEYYKRGSMILDAQFSLKVNGQRVL